MKRFFRSFTLVLLVLGLSSCISLFWPLDILTGKLPVVAREQGEQVLYSNLFAHSTMRLYYLWNEEVTDRLKAWKDDGDPAKQVLAARFRDSATGEEIDHWTQYLDNYDDFVSYVSGESDASYGLGLQLRYADDEKRRVMAVVTFTYPGGPAEAAGLKRGDRIMELNSQVLWVSNYEEVVPGALSGAAPVTLTLSDDRVVTLNPVAMYEDPVLLYKVLDFGTERVGYLFYNKFTLESYKRLNEACQAFRAAGISDLILDLRYNTGGYALAEQFLASLLAPEPVVEAGGVLSMDIYNAGLTEYFAGRDEDTKTYFTQDFSFTVEGKRYRFSTRGANVRVGRLFAIVEDNTASASESLLCDLKAFMPVTLVGARTHGKYCSGLPLSAAEFYDDYSEQLGARRAEEGKRYTENRGMYVMISRFADKNGVTLCMPDGLAPDVAVEDNPLDGYALGDPSESMLSAALAACGHGPAAKQRSAGVPRLERVPGALRGEGYRILNLHPVDADAAALHSAEPGHLPFGKLVDGDGELLPHFVEGE